MIPEIIRKIDGKLPLLEAELTKNGYTTLEFPVQWTFYLYFERFAILLRSSKDLLLEFENNSSYEFPIALNLRTMLLDSLTIIELISNINNGSNIEKRINKLLIDNIIHYFRYFNEESKKGRIDLEIYDELMNKTKERFKILFKKLGIISIKELLQSEKKYRYKSPKSIYNTIITSNLKSFADGYDYYLYYSKFEHFGALYPIISGTAIDKKIGIMNSAFNYIFKIIDYLLEAKE